MSDPENTSLHKEIIVIGSLEHFQGLMEFEQLTNPTYAGYIYENKFSIDTYGPIAGTTSHKKASVYWLVITDVNIVMDDWRMGSATGSGGPFGYLWFTPDMTLDDMDREAQKLNVRLSETVDAGEVRVTELPRGRIRVRFILSKFPNPNLFWKWVDYLVQEMERQGFIQLSRQKEEETQNLIIQHERRLLKLREQAAILGISADPKIPLEIEDIKKEIARLRSTLAN